MQMIHHAGSRGVETALYGWRRYALEAPLIATGLVALDAFVFGGNRFAGVEPHPFWIVVALISVQYGSLGGAWATIVATAALHLGAPPAEMPGDFYVRAGEFARAPFLWLGFALTVGGLRTLQIAHMLGVRDALQDAQEREGIVRDGMRRAVAEIERLETRVAADTRTSDDVLAAAGDFVEAPEFDPQRAAGFAAIAIGATDLSLLRQEADGMQEVARVGFAAPDQAPLCVIELSVDGQNWGALAVWRLNENTDAHDASYRAKVAAGVIQAMLSRGARAPSQTQDDAQVA